MKFSASVSALRAAADAACPTALSKSAIPILSCVRLSARENLRLTGTDMDMEVSAACEAVVTGTGDTCVDAASFRSFVASLPATTQIEGELTATNLILRAGRARGQFKTLDPIDFPKSMLERETTHRFSLQTKELGRIIDRSSCAISTEQTRLYLNGIYFDFKPDSLVCVATNGHLLSRVAIDPPDGTSGAPPIIIPRTTLSALAKLLRGADEDVRIEFSDTIIRFSLGATVLSSKLIDGSFPQYERVIPQRSGAPVRFDRQQMVESLGRLLPIIEVTKDGRKLVATFGDGSVSLEGRGEHGEITEEIEISGAPPEARYCFNGVELRDAIDSLSGGHAELWLTDALSPALAHGSDDPQSDVIVISTRRD